MRNIREKDKKNICQNASFPCLRILILAKIYKRGAEYALYKILLKKFKFKTNFKKGEER